MWSALGLVSLGVVLAWQFRWRWHRPWQGMHADSSQGVRHQYRFLSHRDSTYAVEVGVQVPDFFRFELKHETWVDRFFKWVGLSVEKQFGHDGFDRLVYVASDDAHLHNRVADSPALRLAAQRLFVSLQAGCRTKRVVCEKGWLILRIHRGDLFGSKDDISRLARNKRALLPHLEAVAQALRASKRPAVPPGQRDPHLLPAVLLLSASSGLAIHALFWSLRPLIFDDAFLLDKGRQFELTLWGGSAILLALLAGHFILLARSARAHLYLLELLLVGAFGAYSTAAIELREANIEWDVSAPTVREAPVMDKTISRGRRSGTSYYLHVSDWRGGYGTLSVKVSRSFYESTDKGRVLVFEERPGRFGAAWARLAGARPMRSP